MKKLTQAVFKDAPDWAKSAAVDENGNGFYHNIEVAKLKNDGGQHWPNNHFDYGKYICGVITGAKKSGSYLDAIRFDTTDWQNSAIDRGVKL